MKKANLIKLLCCLVITNLAGYLGSIFTTPAIGSWYVNLNQPNFNPPNWLFAPVWTILFFLMGISLYLIVKDFKPNKKQAKIAVWFFGLQLVFNIFWSILFFGLKRIDLALIEIFVLLFLIIITTVQFAKISRLAAYCLLPYIFWVIFAGLLNFSFWLLN